jgi:cytochrome subunit of sulfide dehydrogenase
MKHAPRIATLFAALAGLHLATPATAQTSPPVAPGVLIATCTGCHGQNGKSAGAIPALAGHDEAALRQAMLDFKNDRRVGTVMNRHAKGFSDDEIAAMAREIAAKWR